MKKIPDVKREPCRAISEEPAIKDKGRP